MALMPFRFVHAADLRLDAPLVGLGNLDEDDLRHADDATLVAFQRVIDVCVDHHAEFLLLTGPVWHESLTPRGWQAFATGCQFLAEYGVRVVWAGGSPADNDQVHLLPAEFANLTRLAESDPEPVAIVREGRVIASLSTSDPQHGPRRPTTSAVTAPAAGGPFHIRILPRSCSTRALRAAATAACDESAAGLMPLLESACHAGIDYLALGGESQRLLRTCESRLLHHPGPPQGLDPGESGPHGCSLIEVPTEGAPRLEFVPTASVRWEHLRVGVERDMSQRQLVDVMQQMLLDQETAPGEQLLAVHWQLTGSGPLFESLSTRDAATRLAEDVDQGLPPCGSMKRQHRFAMRLRIGTEDDPTFEEYRGVLAELGAVALEGPGGEFARDASPPWSRHVIDSLQRQDQSAVSDTALRLGREWLQLQCGRGG